MPRKRKLGQKSARKIVNASRMGTKSKKRPIKVKGKTRKIEDV